MAIRQPARVRPGQNRFCLLIFESCIERSRHYTSPGTSAHAANNHGVTGGLTGPIAWPIASRDLAFTAMPANETVRMEQIGRLAARRELGRVDATVVSVELGAELLAGPAGGAVAVHVCMCQAPAGSGACDLPRSGS